MRKNVPVISSSTYVSVPYVSLLTCPFCKTKISPSPKALFSAGGGRFHFLAKFPCCNRKYFISCLPGKARGYYTDWQVDELTITPRKGGFSETIERISPSFVSIYNETLAAQELGLLQICGGGYRKALEFLMKDYAIALNPDKRETIEKDDLGKCINENFSTATIRDVANRANWLGNDEMHFMKRWTDKDVSDIVETIDLVVEAIELNEKRKRLVKEMPEQKKK